MSLQRHLLCGGPELVEGYSMGKYLTGLWDPMPGIYSSVNDSFGCSAAGPCCGWVGPCHLQEKKLKFALGFYVHEGGQGIGPHKKGESLKNEEHLAQPALHLLGARWVKLLAGWLNVEWCFQFTPPC